MGHGGDHTTQRIVPTKVTGGGIGGAAVVQVAAGSQHTMAIKATGELYAWGKGAHAENKGGAASRIVPLLLDSTRHGPLFFYAVSGIDRSSGADAAHQSLSDAVWRRRQLQ
jgi:alpha-tubulin suppressor-like RCC1 family protein